MHNSGVYYLIIILFMISINTYWSNSQLPLTFPCPPLALLPSSPAPVFAFDCPAIALRVVYRSMRILSTATPLKKMLPKQPLTDIHPQGGVGLIPSFASMTGCWEFILMQGITVVVNSSVQCSRTKKLAFPHCPSPFHCVLCPVLEWYSLRLRV